jgi:dimethylglycine dehydrogenase
VKGEATLANLPNGEIWYGSAAASEYHDMDWLRARLPSNGSIRIESLTDRYTVLVIAGPRSREVLRNAAPCTDWSRQAFPWLSVSRVFIGSAEAIAMSVSFSGELAWELHVPNEQLPLACSTLRDAGQRFGMRLFGLYATESMRIEKGFRHWKSDLLTEFNPFESGLNRFVAMDKNFIGKAALQEMLDAGPRRIFAMLAIETNEAPAQPGDSIVCGGRIVGSVTSAAWGHRVGMNLAMGFVEPSFAALGSNLSVEVVGHTYAAKVREPCIYDPENLRFRS